MIKLHAEQKGKEMLEAVPGKGWKVRVWENSGWHVLVRNGKLDVDYHERDSTYGCSLADDEHLGATPTFWSDPCNSYKTPHDAIKGQLETARNFVEQVTNVLIDTENAIKESR